MTPKRFKAVRKSDGLEAFSNFDLIEAIRGLNHCAGSIDVDGFFSFDLNSTPNLDDVAICQSTGLPGANGLEIYEGDVLVSKQYPGWETFVVGWVNNGFKLIKMSNGEVDPVDDLKKSFVFYQAIGNRWMPAAELQARAEAVSNG